MYAVSFDRITAKRQERTERIRKRFRSRLEAISPQKKFIALRVTTNQNEAVSPPLLTRARGRHIPHEYRTCATTKRVHTKRADDACRLPNPRIAIYADLYARRPAPRKPATALSTSRSCLVSTLLHRYIHVYIYTYIHIYIDRGNIYICIYVSSIRLFVVRFP